MSPSPAPIQARFPERTGDPTLAPAAQAGDRLAASRQRMSNWLEQDRAQRGMSASGIPAGLSGAVGWLQGLRSNPLASIVVDMLQQWWSQWRAGRSERSARSGGAPAGMAPMIQRHPALAVGAAALVGVLLVRWLPWRALLKPALLAGLATQLANAVRPRGPSPRS